MPDLAQEYPDIFYNLELQVVNYYRAHPTLTDYQVDKVYEGLERTLEKELQGKHPPKLRWKDAEERLFIQLQEIGNWLLGDSLTTKDGEPFPPPDEPISKELLVKIIKRLGSSVKVWTGSSGYGQRGYLDYISNFM
jgi:hypothetical protein